jgi:hypothetical protein
MTVKGKRQKVVFFDFLPFSLFSRAQPKPLSPLIPRPLPVTRKALVCPGGFGALRLRVRNHFLPDFGKKLLDPGSCNYIIATM